MGETYYLIAGYNIFSTMQNLLPVAYTHDWVGHKHLLWEELTTIC